ncbi:unnamed protein product [Thlaspi arvense]|uniref:H15 domain-containing protein n=1 Tax=Thlaspi arvense TaxID=13288 RepID=A0AAU9SSY2_THLAR|nr:unnamed protein product [Thlaspi arvense]
MVNLANSRGLLLPGTKLFEQKFLDLCLSRTPDHPTYSAMIFVAITELNKEGGSREEAISEFIKSKYRNLPFAHTSLLSHHLAKLVEKREILCDYNNNSNYCYTLPGEKKNGVASTDAERQSAMITVRTNCQHEEESVRTLKSGDHKVDLFEERGLTKSETSLKRKSCDGINVLEIGDTEVNGVKACLRDSTVEILRKEGVATLPEPEVALEKSETEGRIEVNSEGGELHEVVVLDEQNDVVMEDSSKGKEDLIELISKHRKAKLRRTYNMMEEECVQVKGEAYKTLSECQTEACGNIIALQEMLKQCREKDQQQKNIAVSELDDVSRLPLSMESCKELWKFAHKIQSQLSLIIDSFDEAVVPYNESGGCEIEGTNKEFFKEGPKMRAPRENNGSEILSKQLEQKERGSDSQKKPRTKKTRIKRLRDIGTTVLRKSPRVHNKPI